MQPGLVEFLRFNHGEPLSWLHPEEMPYYVERVFRYVLGVHRLYIKQKGSRSKHDAMAQAQEQKLVKMLEDSYK